MELACQRPQVRRMNAGSLADYASTRSPDLAVLLSILPGSAPPPPRRPELRGSARLPLKRASMALNRFLRPPPQAGTAGHLSGKDRAAPREFIAANGSS
jgi:hypothetical protein